MKIFLDDIDYRKFLFVLSDVLDLYEVECWDFCVMPNHYHLTVRDRAANLSKAMQHLNGEYAIWWNGRHRRVGHVFQGRFKDQVVQREGYLATLFRYIALNPVRAKLVLTPAEWPWSAYASIAGLAPDPGFLRSEVVLGEFGTSSISILRNRYISHVLSAWDEEDCVVKMLRSRRRVVGNGAFKRSVFGDSVAPLESVPPVAFSGGYL